MDQQSADMFGVRRRTFVILGAGQGIGYAAATAFASAGARLVCVDRDSSLAEAVARDVGGLAATGDVTDRADVKRIFAEARLGSSGHRASRPRSMRSSGPSSSRIFQPEARRSRKTSRVRSCF
jgi:hypothetical protein